MIAMLTWVRPSQASTSRSEPAPVPRGCASSLQAIGVSSLPGLRRNRIRRGALAATLAGLVVLCGCGGSDRTPALEPPAPPTATAAAATSGGARADVERALLTLDDLPDGWAAQDHDVEVAGEDSILGCPGLDTLEQPARTDRFDDPDGDDMVFQVAGVFASREAAESAIRAFAAEEARACVADRVGRQVRANADGTDVEVGEASTARLKSPAVGDATAGMQVTVPLRAAGREMLARFDLVTVRVGRAVSVVVFTGVPSFDAELRSELLQVVGQRLGSV
ncbi:MAG: hypothetical protein IRZ28_11245 [Steroidobacteraceae bacterium]|nr:hypothetical protein [Steroidobacteraceae bacterium]